jgi:TRAP-type mannitol/chloroaromatic compound transport system substrate-binding protein
MTSSFPKSYEVLFSAGQLLCRFVAEATDNKFQIQCNAAGELATSRQALDVVTSGVVECAHTPLAFHAAKDMTLGLGTGLPFGLNSRQQMSWWMFGGGADLINASLNKFGVHGLPAGTTGPQMGGWFKREIGGLDDLKALRFRISGLGGPVFAKIGAVPVDMPHVDVVAALESNTIDGAEFLSPHDDERLGLAAVARYNYGPCWWESAGMVHVVVNLEKWNGLPSAYRAVLGRACDAAGRYMLGKYDAVNPPAVKRLTAAGVQLKPFPQPVMEACYRATLEHLAEIAAKDAAFKRALESATAFRKTCLQWLHASDHAIDSFQIAMHGRG